MLQKKSKCRAVILTSLCSFLYVPLMIGVLSNSKPSAVSATAGETVIWTGNETYCQIANSDLPEENPEYLHIEFVSDDNASIYDYEAMSEIAYLSESDHGIISLSDSQWSDIRASGGLWIFSETEPFTQISYKAKEATTSIDKPEADETVFTYTGEEQTYVIEENDAYTVSDNVQTDAGEYEVTVSLKDPTTTTWDDGTTDDVTFEFVINKAQVAKPNADTTSFTYNGQNQTYNIPSSDAYAVSGNVQKNAGTYTVTVSLNDRNNTCWADGSSEDLTFTFVIAKVKVAKPAADTSSFTYNGEDQTYNIASSDLYTVSGNVAKEPGTHQVTVSLKDINNYEWEDSTTANLTYDFVIADKTCINHWFLIGILAFGLVLVSLSLFVLKDNLVGAISSGVFLVGSIVSTIFCGCTICIVFAVVDLALFVVSTGMFTFKFISKKKQKDSKKEDQDQPEDEKENN